MQPPKEAILRYGVILAGMEYSTRLRALVVDDDSSFCRVAVHVLGEAGFDCVAVQSGADALAQLSAATFDLLLCDLVLPPPDGRAIVEHLRTLAEPPEAVILTGVSPSEPSLAPLRAAGCTILFKPLDSAELSRSIASVMHARALQRGDATRTLLESLYKLTTLTTADATLNILLDQILGISVTMVGGDAGCIMLSTGTQRTLAPVASTGTEGPGAQPPTAFWAGVCGWVAQTRRPLRIAGDVRAYSQFAALEPDPASAESIHAPIVNRTEVLGVISLSSRQPGRLGPESLAPLCAIADIVSSVLVRDRAERLREHQDRLALLGQLSASVVHELTNPLTYVKANLGTLQEMLASHATRETKVRDLGGDVHDLLRDVIEGVNRMAAIVANTRAAARKPAGTAKEVDLAALLRRAETLVYPQFKHRVKLHVDVTSEPLTVIADEGRILQVVMNLLVNAGQAVGAKGTVTLRGRAADNWATVEVEDDGPGIPKEVAAQLFQPFFTTKPEGEGTGLGLSISRQIAQEHEGDLTFTTEPGKGTCFKLTLPLAAKAQLPQQRPTVLVVEDETALLNAVKRVLNGTFTVLAASSGPEALEIAAGKQLALILTDYSMPGQDGLSLVRAMRQQGHTAPAALLTAVVNSDEVVEALRKGEIAEVIGKPWSPRSLLGDVVRLCSAAPTAGI